MKTSSNLFIIIFGFHTCQIINLEEKMLVSGSLVLNVNKKDTNISPDSCANFPQIHPTRCINCEPAKRGDFPWHVEVTDDEGYLDDCGGTLISPKIVITAGSCVKHSMVEYLRIKLGQLDRSKDEQEKIISRGK